jgi:hypothetical protein
MRPRTATYLSRLRGTGGAPAYPGIGAKGGVLLGLPVITSANVPVRAVTGDPSYIVLLDASAVALADDGESRLNVSLNASVQLDDAAAPGAQNLASLWQLGLLGIRAERIVNWKLRRAGFVQVLDGVTY